MDHAIRQQRDMETVIQMLIDHGVRFDHFTKEE